MRRLLGVGFFLALATIFVNAQLSLSREDANQLKVEKLTRDAETSLS